MNPLQWGTPSRSKQGYAALTKEIITEVFTAEISVGMQVNDGDTV